MKPISCKQEWDTFFNSILPRKNSSTVNQAITSSLKVNIPISIILGLSGYPSKILYTTKSGHIREQPHQTVTYSLILKQLVKESEKRKYDKDSPLCIVRFGFSSRFLYKDNFQSFLDETIQLNWSNDKLKNDEDLSLKPFVMQQYIKPYKDIRWISVFVLTESTIICETFSASYSERYPFNPHINTNDTSTDMSSIDDEIKPEVKEIQPQPHIIEETKNERHENEIFNNKELMTLKIRRHTMMIANHISKSRERESVRIVGLVLEFIQDFNHPETLVCTGVLGHKWNNYEASWITTKNESQDSQFICTIIDNLPAQSVTPEQLAGSGASIDKSQRKVVNSKRTEEPVDETSAPNIEDTHNVVANKRINSITQASPTYNGLKCLPATVVKRGDNRIMNEKLSIQNKPAGTSLGGIVSGSSHSDSFNKGSGRSCCNSAYVIDLIKSIEGYKIALQYQTESSLHANEIAKEAQLKKENMEVQLLKYKKDFDSATKSLMRDVQEAQEATKEMRKVHATEMQSKTNLYVEHEKTKDENFKLKVKLDSEREIAFKLLADMQKRCDELEKKTSELTAENIFVKERETIAANLRKEDTAQAMELRATVADLKREVEYKNESITRMDSLRKQALNETYRYMRLIPANNLATELTSGVTIQRSRRIVVLKIDDLLREQENPVAELEIVYRLLSDNKELLEKEFDKYSFLCGGEMKAITKESLNKILPVVGTNMTNSLPAGGDGHNEFSFVPRKPQEKPSSPSVGRIPSQRKISYEHVGSTPFQQTVVTSPSEISRRSSASAVPSPSLRRVVQSNWFNYTAALSLEYFTFRDFVEATVRTGNLAYATSSSYLGDQLSEILDFMVKARNKFTSKI